MGPIDTHAHLSDLTDPQSTVKRSKKVGLSGIVAVSATVPTFEDVKRLTQANPGYVHMALGVHPTEFFDQDLAVALKNIRENADSCVAIGEIGLDYWNKRIRKDQALKNKQIEFYVGQLTLARELGLPISIHSRGAWSDCLRYALENGSVKGVFHWYSGPLDVLKKVLDNGFYVSCTPALESSSELRAAMSEAPIERILVETDSPVWIRSQNRPSEPSDVLLTVKHLAEIKKITEEEVAEITTRNAKDLFKL